MATQHKQRVGAITCNEAIQRKYEARVKLVAASNARQMRCRRHRSCAAVVAVLPSRKFVGFGACYALKLCEAQNEILVPLTFYDTVISIRNFSTREVYSID